MPQLEADRYYRVATYLYPPLQDEALVWATWFGTIATISWISQIGLALTVRTVGGVAINAAYELGHKRDKLERSRFSRSSTMASIEHDGLSPRKLKSGR